MHAVRITSATGRTGRVMWPPFRFHSALAPRLPQPPGPERCAPASGGGDRMLLEHLPRDHHLLHLGRSLVDLADPRVTPVALDLELRQIAIASVHLDRPVRAPGAGFAGV